MLRLHYVTRRWLRDRYPCLDMLTDEQVEKWACPRCHSMPGDPCGTYSGQIRSYHPVRLFQVLDMNAYQEAKYKEEQDDATE